VWVPTATCDSHSTGTTKGEIEPTSEAKEMGKQPHIAFVGHDLPFAQTAGHQRVNMALLRFLRTQGWRISMILTAPRLPGPVAANPYHPDLPVVGPEIRTLGRLIVPIRAGAFAKLLAKRIVETSPPFLQYAVQWLRTVGSPTTKEVLGRFPSEAQIDWVVRWIGAARPDVVLFDTIFRCPIIPRLSTPSPKTVVLTHDIFHLRHASFVGRGITIEPANLTYEQESALLRPADILVAITPEDQPVLAEMAPKATVVEASMPVMCAARPPSIGRDNKLALFVGSSGIHNVDGLRWFLAEVWPLVRAATPDARLAVCGLAGRGIPRPPAGVTLYGQVDDLLPHYHTAGHAVCPLRAGSGLKIKMLEYFAHGLPCVTTSVGAGGFVASAAPPFVVADTPRAFADAMLSFMANPQRITAFEDRAFAYCEHYSEARVFGALFDLLQPACRHASTSC
jgi:glycosyltransferase involved in cell wall biosynthesis